MKRFLTPTLVITLVTVFYGCGGGSPVSPEAPPARPSMGIVPAMAAVPQGGMQKFSAFVNFTSNTAVSWSVSEGAAGGSINSAGMYTAPAAAGTYHVVATSVADSAVTATAAITVPSVSISVSPLSSLVRPGGTKTFMADVEGTVNKSVTWTLQEGTAGGSISGGVYTAPADLGTYHIIATSSADPSKAAMASVTVAAMSGSFNPTGNMNAVSGTHTATLLPSGEVLVTGGCGGEDYMEVGQADAELYDPTTGSFTKTGSMQSPRCRHTATLLPNGKALVIGGFEAAWDGPAYASNTAELYDSATGSLAAAGHMTVARADHTATLLPNGKVLIAGGAHEGGWGFPLYVSAVASAEIYDPATNSFTATGNMANARFGHTATLLPNGKVLIAGGLALAGEDQINQVVPSFSGAELYDPETGTFSPAGNMSVARAGQTATLLPSGKVLLSGGMPTNHGPALSSAELYDPATGTFAPAGNMNSPRTGHNATLLTNGEVLFAGGNSAFTTVDTAELYNPATGSFIVTDSMTTPRSEHSATLLRNGTVLITGGNDGSLPLSGIPRYLQSAEIFSQ